MPQILPDMHFMGCSHAGFASDLDIVVQMLKLLTALMEDTSKVVLVHCR